MQRSLISKTLSTTRILRPTTQFVHPNNAKSSSTNNNVFINHRGIDTKKTIAGLLYQHLSNLGFNPFLDSKSMKPGDKLFEKINLGIKQCQVGVAVFSPRYCDSYFCLHELALMMETKKKVVPIFCDVKPSELKIKDNNGSCSSKELERFQRALQEARYTVGLTFDSSTGDWSDFLTSATDAIVQRMHEAQETQKHRTTHNITKYVHANSTRHS